MKLIPVATLTALTIALPALATSYFASPNGGGDGLSAASPTTLSSAVSSAQNAGDEVVLADGEYPLTAQITINRDITVRGTTRDGTIVKRSSGSIRLFELNSAGAVLSTMTVSGGYDVNGANVLINTGGGTVTNCVLRNGYRSGNGTGGAAACLMGGLLTDCLITNNLASINANDHSGAAVWFKGCTGATMRRCILANNESRCQKNCFVGAAATAIYNDANSVVIDSCTFANNKGNKSGGIFAAAPKTTPIVTNCLFTGNVAVRSSVGNRDYTGSFKAVSYCAFDADATKTGTAHGVKGHNAIDPATFAPRFDSVAIGARADGGDIGAVQHIPSPNLVAYAEVPQVRHAAPFAATFMAYANQAGASFAWNFGDGATDTTATGEATHTYATPGTYSPTLTVSAGGESVAVPLPAITVCPATFAVSNETELKNALASAGDGSIITVATGTYTFSSGTTRDDFSNTASALFVTNGVTLVSATGKPEDVIFTVSGNTFANLTSSSRKKLRLITVNHPDAVIAGISFRFGAIDGVYHFGGGVFVDYDGGLVSNCVFTGCSSFNNAGGGAALGLYGSGLAVNCVLTNNYSKINSNDNHGGTLLMYGDAIARGCLIAHNDAKADAAKTTYNVGGVALYGSSVLESCTVAGNTSFGCGGVRQYSDSATVRNCQIQGNSSSGYAADSVHQQYYAAKASLFINCTSTVAISGGTACQTGAMPVADAENGDWRPAYGSEAIGNGLVQPWMAGAADLDGHPRLGDGGSVDIGAYQYQAKAVNGSLTLSGSSGAIPYPVAFSASANSDLGAITAYVWDFGDGSATVTTTVPETTHTYTAIGTYTPSLSVVIGGTSYPIESVATIEAGPDLIYVVNAVNNPVAAYPYRTWETATTNLATAISAAVDGTVIALSRGVHTNRFTATIDKGITIRSETGNPADTTVLRIWTKDTCRTFDVNHAAALVHGITISGGRIHDNSTTYGAGLLIRGYGGTVSNCVFTGNQITGNQQNASAGAAAALLGGLVTHCVMTNNMAKLSSNDNGTGGGILRVFASARAAFCLIANNRVDDSALGSNYDDNFSCAVRLSEGTVESCTIASNDVSRGWALATTNKDKGVIRNCLVAGNRSSSATALDRVFQGNVYGHLDHCCGDVAYAGANEAKWRSGESLVRDIDAGDFRPALRAGNPAIGNALVTDSLRASLDLLGQPMVGPNGKADIGAFASGGRFATLILVQ